VQAEKASYPVRTLCRVLAVSASGFYAWRQRPAPPHAQADRRLRAHIRAVHAASRGTYGSPRVQQALRHTGEVVGRNRVIRLMQAEHLVGRPRRRFRLTTQAAPAAAPAPNHLAQHFAVRHLNHVWAGDLTALPTTEGWLYLAVLLDLCSRRVVGWATDCTLGTALVSAAWQRALARRGTAPRLHHSDRGCQYTSAQYQTLLRAHGVRCSMSRRGNCYDNAPVESFFRTLKLEISDRPLWRTRRDAAEAVADYIDGFYNSSRLHSALGYRSPAQFEWEHRLAA
jgi:transposase InsO family protein